MTRASPSSTISAITAAPAAAGEHTDPYPSILFPPISACVHCYLVVPNCNGSPYHNIVLPGYLDIRLPQYHTATMPYSPATTISYCYDAIQPGYHNIILLRCHTARLPQYHTATMPYSPATTISYCYDAQPATTISYCYDAIQPGYHNIILLK